MELYKRYVDVVVKQTKNGNIVPLYVCWDNGMSYQIDKVLSKERRASQVGGCGVRYVCMICGQRRNLFLEKNRWFIENMHP